LSEPLLSPSFLRQLDRLDLSTRRKQPGRMQGERRGPRRGGGQEFADYRPYTPGDDLRQVDWNAYARMERFFLRLFVEEEDTTLHLLMDASRSMGWGTPTKLDFARRCAAALGYVALSRSEWVSPLAFTTGREQAPRPLRGRRSASRLFETLSAVQADGGTDLRTTLRRHAAASRVRGPLILMSDLYDPEWRSALRAALGAGFDLSVIHVLSPEEIEPSLDGDLRLVDDETGRAIEIRADEETLKRYRARLDAWREEIRGFCAGRGVPYVPVSSDFPLESFVLDVLRRQAVVVGR
jgi:uncharacterized protein (DUF58 family)